MRKVLQHTGGRSRINNASVEMFKRIKYTEKSENCEHVLCKPELLKASMSVRTEQRNSLQ